MAKLIIFAFVTFVVSGSIKAHEQSVLAGIEIEVVDPIDVADTEEIGENT